MSFCIKLPFWLNKLINFWSKTLIIFLRFTNIFQFQHFQDTKPFQYFQHFQKFWHVGILVFLAFSAIFTFILTHLSRFLAHLRPIFRNKTFYCLQNENFIFSWELGFFKSSTLFLQRSVTTPAQTALQTMLIFCHLRSSSFFANFQEFFAHFGSFLGTVSPNFLRFLISLGFSGAFFLIPWE